MDAKRERLLLALVLLGWIAVQVPFLGTAFRIDEPNIIRIAQQAAKNPLDPYGFQINWVGRDEDAFGILANPPGVPLWLAAWGSTLGWSELVLHASMLPFSLICLLAFARLARELGANPIAAVCLLAVSPAFFLSSQVVMPDIAMMAFMLLSILAALLYQRTGAMWLIAAGFAAGFLSPIAKYNGVIGGVVVGLVWLFARERKKGLFVIALGPAAGLVAWSLWSFMVYGRAHILVIAEFESEGLTNIFSALIAYWGLSVMPLALALPRAPDDRSKRPIALITVAAFVLLAGGAHWILGFGSWASIAYGLSGAIGLRLVAIVLVSGRGWLRDWNATGLILFLWIAVGIWFQFKLLFASARYLLPLLPPAILLVLWAGLIRTDSRWFRVATVGCLVLAAAVAIGDARTANIYRTFVNEVVVPEHEKLGGRFFFDGHWGFQYYAEESGGKILNYWKQERWRPGDFVAIAKTPFPSHTYPQTGRGVKFRSTRSTRSPDWPVRTIDCAVPANFYGPGMQRCRGPVLPFGIATGDSDEFEIFVAEPYEVRTK